MRNRLFIIEGLPLKYKIYDFLPWEIEMPIMLDKWQQFVQTSSENITYIFNCVLLQNPMCETMMRFGFSEEESETYIRCLEERQKRELRILSGLPVRKLIFNNPQKDWNSAQEIIKKYIMTILCIYHTGCHNCTGFLPHLAADGNEK